MPKKCFTGIIPAMKYSLLRVVIRFFWQKISQAQAKGDQGSKLILGKKISLSTSKRNQRFQI